jgi:Protein of unknown function (DUF3619)
MTHDYTQQTDVLVNRFGFKVVGVLTSAQDELSYDVTERLRAARMQALAKRKVSALVRTAETSVNQGGAIALHWGGSDGFDFWSGLASVLPLVALVVGLLAIQSIQEDYRVSEMAAVDSALLSDDLPPSAYADDGFTQFLKHQR